MSPENFKLEAVSLGRHGERIRMEMELRRNQWKQHPDYGNDDDDDDESFDGREPIETTIDGFRYDKSQQGK